MVYKIVIRPEKHNDIPFIRHVHEQAFQPSTNEARLVQLLREANQASVSLVALINDQVIGHVLFSPIIFDPNQSAVYGLGLAPVGVLPEYQNQGVGAMLIKHGLQACKRMDCDLVVVLGSPKYYSRFRFVRAKDYQLENEYGADKEFMVIELRSGVLDSIVGLVKYQPEFKEADC